MTRLVPVLGELAVHESGHALGRFITAEPLGFAPEQAITYIEVRAVPVSLGVESLDRKGRLHSQTVTFGPMFSRSLQEFIRAQALTGDSPREVPLDEIADILRKARAAGLDVDGWFHAKALSNVLGPMAEAHFLQKPVDDVLRGYAAEEDMRTIVKESRLAGMTTEELMAALDVIIDRAKQELARPEVWRAILALANRLRPGRMSGRKAAEIITRALAQYGAEAGIRAAVKERGRK